MIVTFCGHSSFVTTKEREEKMLSVLEEIIGDSEALLYLGGYGSFDAFAHSCGKKYQKSHPATKLILVTPYLKIKKDELDYIQDMYDESIYPELERVPPRYAILRRNRRMAEQADYVIAYVDHDWGGAYQTYTYAKKKGKTVINLADKDI